MKTTLLISAGLCLATLCGQAQTASPARPANQQTAMSSPDAKNLRDTNQVFIDRYFAIRDTKKDMKDYYGSYATSMYTLNEYLGRFEEIKKANPEMKKYFGNYAGCVYNLRDFLKRFNEIKAAYPKAGMDNAFGYYASSKWTLDKFVERYYQIKASYPKMDKYFGAYAGAYYSMDDFMKRLYAIKDSYPKGLEESYGDYAAGYQKLQASKEEAGKK